MDYGLATTEILGVAFLLWPVVGALISFAYGKGYAVASIIYSIIEMALCVSFYITWPSGGYAMGIGGYIFLIAAALLFILGLVCLVKYGRADREERAARQQQANGAWQ